MEFIFIFAIVFIKVFLFHFFKIVEIIRALWIHTFMYAEELTVFPGNKCISAVRAGKSKWCCDDFAGRESLTADFALVLTVSTIIVINVVMRSTTQRTDGIFGNGFAIATLDRLNRFLIFPVIVFEKELPVLFDKGFDDGKLINLKFLILWRMGIIKSPLFKRDISADKI